MSLPMSPYTITLDSDPAAQAKIAEFTGMPSRWFQSAAALELDGLKPEAVFVEARLGVESAEDGHLITRLRDAFPASPIILMGNEADIDLLTEGMALGADDFVARPFCCNDLGRRFTIRRTAMARRAARETLTFGDVTIDTLQRSVVSPRGQRFLSPTEIKLLAELVKAGANVVQRDTLKARCWPGGDVSDNALNRKLYEIRRRLKPITDSINIRTIYGVGFIMEQK